MILLLSVYILYFVVNLCLLLFCKKILLVLVVAYPIASEVILFSGKYLKKSARYYDFRIISASLVIFVGAVGFHITAAFLEFKIRACPALLTRINEYLGQTGYFPNFKGHGSQKPLVLVSFCYQIEIDQK